MRMMLLAAAAAMSLGSVSAFANAGAPQAQHASQYMYQQTQQYQPFTHYAPQGSGIHYHPQRNTNWIGSSGNG